MTAVRADQWLAHPPSSDGSVRLLCLPPSGAGAAFFAPWRRPLAADGLDVLPVLLPGREVRLNETPATDLRSLAAALATAVQDVLAEAPYVIFGHSMGGALGFQLAVELRRLGGPAPRGVVISACGPPHLSGVDEAMRDAPHDELVQLLRQLGGTPEALLTNAAFMAMTVPIFRADLGMCETFERRPEERIDAPIVAVGGSQDDAVLAATLSEWRDYTSGGFDTLLVPGGHDYCRDGQAGLAAVRRSVSTALAL